MSRVLVVYTSRSGRTRTLANEVASRLRARGHDVEIANPHDGRLPPPQDYDAVILGTRFRRHPGRTLEGYVREYRDALEAIPIAFFSARQRVADARQVADNVTESLAPAPPCELSPCYGPI